MDRVYMDMAYEEAERSKCIRNKVGCVFVLDGKVIAQGYNHVTGGVKDCALVGCIRDKMNIPSGERREVCKAICAEQLAITEAARNGVELDGATAYITTFPCYICAKMLLSSGIYEIVYDKEYNDPISKQFLDEAGATYRKI